MKISKSAATIAVILMAVAVVGGTYFFKGSQEGLLKKGIATRSQGDPKAPIQIVEYIDFECGACVNGYRVLKDYMAKNPSKIFLQVRYYPISRIHQYAVKSATYAECAARQDKFFPFVDSLIEKQSVWSRMLNAEGMFRELAQKAGVNLDKFNGCLQEEKVKALILDEKEQAKVLGVNSTPTYFINGKMVVGPKPLKEELDRLLGGQSH